jgi:transcriptional regulator with XRE-family HTH domain
LELPADTVSKAVGEELRRAREAQGWSRLQLVEQLPSGIGDRTLLAYEHGKRQMLLVRFAELSWALDIDPPTMFARGLQRARVSVENLTLHVDLRALLRDERVTFLPLKQWARNTLNDHPDGVALVEPVVVRNLASFIGCHGRDMADYLARFTPEVPEEEGGFPTS